MISFLNPNIQGMAWTKFILGSRMCHEAARWANQGSKLSWTKSGLSSWGQCPTPSSIQSLTFESWEGNEEKYLPTGPSIGVNGSWSPQRTRIGMEIPGISVTGFGPGGPVTIETKASSAPSSHAGPLIIWKFPWGNESSEWMFC